MRSLWNLAFFDFFTDFQLFFTRISPFSSPYQFLPFIMTLDIFFCIEYNFYFFHNTNSSLWNPHFWILAVHLAFLERFSDVFSDISPTIHFFSILTSAILCVIFLCIQWRILFLEHQCDHCENRFFWFLRFFRKTKNETSTSENRSIVFSIVDLVGVEPTRFQTSPKVCSESTSQNRDFGRSNLTNCICSARRAFCSHIVNYRI